MEFSTDSTLQGSCDVKSSKLKNSKVSSNSNKKRNRWNKLQGLKLSPNRKGKDLTLAQSSTINTWLTKDLAQKKSKSYKLDNKKLSDISNNSEQLSKSCELINTEDENKNITSKVNNENVRDKHMKKSKKEIKKFPHSSSKASIHNEESVYNIIDYKKNNKYKYENTPYDSEEEQSKKKFKRIITAPLSLTTSVDKKIISPQSNTIKMWLNRHNSSSSFSREKQGKMNSKNCNYKDSEKENSCKENTICRDDQSKRFVKSTTLKNKDYRAEQTYDSDITTTPKKQKKKQLKLTTLNKSVELPKSLRTIIDAKNSKKGLPEKSTSTSEIKHATNQIKNDVTITTKQKKNSTMVESSCRTTKKPKHIAESSKEEKSGSISSNSKTNAWICVNRRKDNKITERNSSKSTKNHNRERNEEIPARRSKTKKKTAEKTLDDYVNKCIKELNTQKVSRSESNESFEFPSFISDSKKVKSTKSSEFKKYGVAVPSFDEIVKEQQELAQYKNQIESFRDVDDKFFELPFSVKDLKCNQAVNVNILGCKHLSIDEIEEAFYNNFDHISAIFHGKKYNERHKRFFDVGNKKYTFTVKDLCYNTSMIVFNFEQKEHLLTLLKKHFDPEDKRTLYFFQVLLPELCLKIFMDTHDMTYDEATKYLDTRPIIDD